MYKFNSNKAFVSIENPKSYKIIFTQQEIKDYFVDNSLQLDNFLKSQKRQPLWDAYYIYNQQLKAILGASVPIKQWTNGSFISAKTEPNDIDIVTFIDENNYQVYKNELENLRDEAKKWPFPIDSYFIQVYNENQAEYKNYQADVAYWFDLFSKTTPTTNKLGNIKKGTTKTFIETFI